MERRNDRGSALVVALLLVTLFALIVPALLGLALTGTRVTSSVVNERRTSYVASSALDVAIQTGRRAGWVGRFGLDCPTMNMVIDGQPAVVRCETSTGSFDLDRSVTFDASVEGISRARAEVVFRDSRRGQR